MSLAHADPPLSNCRESGDRCEPPLRHESAVQGVAPEELT
jgi:hypothetical protein